MVRDALCAYLSGRPEFDIVGQTAGIAGLIALCSLRRPAVVLVDAPSLSVEIVDGLRGLREAFPTTEVVVAYSELTSSAFGAAVQAGITALIPCSRGLEAIIRAVRRRGGTVAGAEGGAAALTEREMQIISLLGT
ncbi:MAG: hypothetical protein ACM30G_08200, partial [Micromonosporaceae bacterium]